MPYFIGRLCGTDALFPWFSDKSMYDQFIKQGEEDFEIFLVHRAKELKKGCSHLRVRVHQLKTSTIPRGHIYNQ